MPLLNIGAVDNLPVPSNPLPAPTERIPDQENGWFLLPRRPLPEMKRKVSDSARSMHRALVPDPADLAAVDGYLQDNADWFAQARQAMNSLKFQKKPFVASDAASKEAAAQSKAFLKLVQFLSLRIRSLLFKGAEHEAAALADLRLWHHYLTKLERGGLDFYGWTVWFEGHLKLQGCLQDWLRTTQSDPATVLQTLHQFAPPTIPAAVETWRLACANEFRNLQLLYAPLAKPGAEGETALLRFLAESEATGEIMQEVIAALELSPKDRGKKGGSAKSGAKPESPQQSDAETKVSPSERMERIVQKLLAEWSEPAARPEEVTRTLKEGVGYDWPALIRATGDEYTFIANLPLGNLAPDEIKQALKARVESANLGMDSKGFPGKIGYRPGPPVGNPGVILAPWQLIQKARMTSILAAWVLHRKAHPNAEAPAVPEEFVRPGLFAADTLIDPLSEKPFVYDSERGFIDLPLDPNALLSDENRVSLPNFPQTIRASPGGARMPPSNLGK